MKKKLSTFRVWHLTKFGIGTEVIKAESKTDAKARFMKKRKGRKVLSVDTLCL